MGSIATFLSDLLSQLLAFQPIADAGSSTPDVGSSTPDFGSSTPDIGFSTPDVGSSWTLGGGVQPL